MTDQEVKECLIQRENNAKIAELVFGFEVCRNKRGGWSLGPANWYDSYGEMILFNPLPDYFGDIKEAWEVVEKLRSKYKVFSLSSLYDTHEDVLEWVAKWEYIDTDYDFVFSRSKSASAAICEATLKLFDSVNKEEG